MDSTHAESCVHGMRKGRWLSAGVSKINLRNLALNHATRRSLHNHFDSSCFNVMHEELNDFERKQVWTLVDPPPREM
jgi:hypothetical protein